MEKYKVLIGLEMHCEISETKSKVFSSARNSYSEIPNSNIRPVDMAFPGTLPVVNKEAVKKALMASIILNCKQPEYIYFERKNYYYPDLPKGFQITQETKPAPVGIYGNLTYDVNGVEKTVRINNIHLEEDAASSNHFSRYSTIDYNRAGVPLLELVTEPDLHSAEEAVAFLETMRTIYQYAGISEADSKKGQIRCDVNVSIMNADKDEKDPKNWGTKIEIKNVNSFGGVRDAINYEIERQIEAKEDGTYDQMEQQTRRWDEESATTIYMRSKVDAIDYKYFVEPNIPKFKLSQEWIKEISDSIPELANSRRDRYKNEYHLSDYDATILVKEKAVSDYFDETVNLGADPKMASNWITSIILGYINKNDLTIHELYLRPNMLKDLIELVSEAKISSKQGKEVLYRSLDEKKEPTKIVEEEGMKQIGGTDEILKVVTEVLDEQPQGIEQYKNGRTNIVDFLVGQVMKKTRGQANPAMARSMMIEEIEKR
ncbi:MAG: Asp-tRNA(Asn)/Glu-tRNA(Gln) amidotransferase subunit GatB [Tenericutes bacterium]|nr:Asp-tRNA(Asn)/Glu-tRNA(Gln) amidotransferase subunit GatB [Mycoplasmatota bacterium]